MNLPSSNTDSGHIIAGASLKTTDAAIGKLLQDAGKLKQQDMERVLKLQQEQNLRFGEAAIKLGLVTEADIQHAHIDDLNALSFLDYLRDLAVNSGRQIFFATADTRVASLFSKKFSFLGESFKTISLVRSPQVEDAAAG